MNIYVGNLSYEVTGEDLRLAFEAHGQVSSASVVKDKYSGQSRGFGFVEMPEKAEAQAAIQNLNGKDLKGQSMNVNEARPRADHGKGGRPGGRSGQRTRLWRRWRWRRARPVLVTLLQQSEKADVTRSGWYKTEDTGGDGPATRDPTTPAVPDRTRLYVRGAARKWLFRFPLLMTRSSCVWSASRNRRFLSKDGYPLLFHSSGIGLLNPPEW